MRGIPIMLIVALDYGLALISFPHKQIRCFSERVGIAFDYDRGSFREMHGRVLHRSTWLSVNGGATHDHLLTSFYEGLFRKR